MHYLFEQSRPECHLSLIQDDEARRCEKNIRKA